VGSKSCIYRAEAAPNFSNTNGPLNEKPMPGKPRKLFLDLIAFTSTSLVMGLGAFRSGALTGI